MPIMTREPQEIDKELNKTFKHHSWFKGQKKTIAEALDYFASTGDFYLGKKPAKKQSDRLLDDVVYDNVLYYSGKEGGFYTLSDIELDYFLKRKEYWDNEKKLKKEEYLSEKIDLSEELKKEKQNTFFRPESEIEKKYSDRDVKDKIILVNKVYQIVFEEVLEKEKNNILTHKDFQQFKKNVDNKVESIFNANITDIATGSYHLADGKTINDIKNDIKKSIENGVYVSESIKEIIKNTYKKTDTDMPIMERLPQSVEEIKTENLPIEENIKIIDNNKIFPKVGDKVYVHFRKENGVVQSVDGDFVNINYPKLEFSESVNIKMEKIDIIEESENEQIEQDNADDKDYQLVVTKLKDLFATYKLDKNNKEIVSQLYGTFANFLHNYLSKGYFNDINLFFEINAELPKKFKEFVDLNDAEYSDFGSNLISKGVNIWNYIPESYKQVADIKKVNYTISKDDEKLLSLFTPFVLKDDMFGGSRLLMEGVSFDEYGVVATDAHKLLFIPAEHKIRGTYCSTKKCFKDAENVQPLEQNQNSSSNKVYPKYQSIVPSNKNTLDLNAYSLLSFLNAFQKSNLVNEQSGVIILLIEEIYFGFNLERLKDCVEAILKLGYSEITLSFSDNTHAVCITPKGMYDGYKIKSLQIPFALIMPTNIDGVGYQSQNKNRWFYFDCNNESFMQKDSQPISLNPMVIKEKALEEKTKKLENLVQEVSEKLKKIEAKEKEIIQTPIEKQKTYLTDITILWSEGLEKDNIKCETLADLQRYLRKAFGDLKPNEGYVKTKVLFTFDNGDTLEKRIDLGYSKGDFNPKETIIQDYIAENILSWNPMDKSTRDLEKFEYVFDFKESPITEQAPIVEEVQEVEQPKQKPTVEELQERISIIKRMIAKGKGNKEELEERISIVERMIKKYSKFAQGGLIDGASQDYLYRLLSRLQEDCEYFLNAGGRNEKHLWSGSVDTQIKDMKDIYNRLDVKPDWLTMEQIEFYRDEMKKIISK